MTHLICNLVILLTVYGNFADALSTVDVKTRWGHCSQQTTGLRGDIHFEWQTDGHDPQQASGLATTVICGFANSKPLNFKCDGQGWNMAVTSTMVNGASCLQITNLDNQEDSGCVMPIISYADGSSGTLDCPAITLQGSSSLNGNPLSLTIDGKASNLGVPGGSGANNSASNTAATSAPNPVPPPASLSTAPAPQTAPPAMSPPPPSPAPPPPAATDANQKLGGDSILRGLYQSPDPLNDGNKLAQPTQVSSPPAPQTMAPAQVTTAPPAPTNATGPIANINTVALKTSTAFKDGQKCNPVDGGMSSMKVAFESISTDGHQPMEETGLPTVICTFTVPAVKFTDSANLNTSISADGAAAFKLADDAPNAGFFLVFKTACAGNKATDMVAIKSCTCTVDGGPCTVATS
ncbi:hypothetical protein SeMB42_g00304 [Synchytrium endobioticum]|uniref:Uncharacterized protein n=1 Tax=Synchytrium endobioticum TaxID=286115 RepID=A0A507DTS3_9FUNG|nr:hypothetical protein SeLEV6574_g00666 [Synchytrium endobioticum]TPX54348.1 hypothetical protein SeMB42_g00304 [Synchytrium endobioticum]